MDLDYYSFDIYIPEPTPDEQEPYYNPNREYYNGMDAREMACWDLIGIDKVHIPTDQYPVPENPLCYECYCSVPDGIHVRNNFTHIWR